MLANYLPKIQHVFKYLLLSGVVISLFNCSSSPKMASGFAKRKYTRGHFSDPVAKVKTDYDKGVEKTVIDPPKTKKSEEIADKMLSKLSDNNPMPFLFTSAKAQHFFTHLKPVQQAIALAKSPSVSNTGNNVSLKESSVSADYPYQEHGYLHENDHRNARNTYLIAWLVCLAIVLICVVLLVAVVASAASGNGAGVAGTGCIFYSLIILASIGALVFFILWIVAMAT